MKRVVITGMGAVTPLAATFDRSWESIKQGLSGISKITRVADTKLKWKAAGEVHNLSSDFDLSAKESKFIDPFSLFAIVASRAAVECAGLISHNTNSLLQAGILIGSSRGGVTTMEKEFMKLASKTASHIRLSPFVMPMSTISSATAAVAMKLGIRGHCLGISNACSSGTNAIGEAFHMIRSGLSEVLVAGGAEAPLCRLCIEGYGSSGALSKSGPEEACCPFDVRRNGFVLSEGACILVLEELESALQRNVPIFAEIIGYGNTCDASHPTKPSVEGEIMAMRAALHDAGISASDVDYVNAHGTSTILGDKVEAEAIKNVFGKSLVPVSSVKSMTGHMLAASGAFETACTAMSLKQGFVPATINTRTIDPACSINLITQPHEASLDIAITNSFGFGGLNAVLVLKRFRPD
jgi:3-oxoacyl-[acyl-carrier-protein] synthase II